MGEKGEKQGRNDLSGASVIFELLYSIEICRALSGQRREIEGGQGNRGKGGLWADEPELCTQSSKNMQEHCWGETYLLGLVLSPR